MALPEQLTSSQQMNSPLRKRVETGRCSWRGLVTARLALAAPWLDQARRPEPGTAACLIIASCLASRQLLRTHLVSYLGQRVHHFDTCQSLFRDHGLMT